MKEIVIYAEKPDVAYKISTAFGGIDIVFKGATVKVSMNDYEKYKPAIERKYGKQGYVPFIYNGDSYKVTWGTGHMCSLKQAEDYNSEYSSWIKIPKPFFPDKYEIKIREGINYKTKRAVKVDPSAKTQLAIIKKLFQSCDLIINATDDDREGELIFAYVYEILNSKKPYKRVFLDSYTESSIKKAFTKLKDMSEVKSVEMAGRARNIADWIVGANLTVATTLQFGKGLSSSSKKPTVLSVGRVQTPTLNLLVERENEINNFKPKTTYYLQGEFSTKDGSKSSYIGTCDSVEYETEKDAKLTVKDLENEDATVIIYDRKEKYTEAPLLYSLSSLSMDANSHFSMTAKQTLNAAQKLYTSGYLTYPRTSSCYLPDDMKDTINDVLDALGLMPEFHKYVSLVPKSLRRMTNRHFNSKKVTSHYAIVPTNKTPDLSKLNSDEVNIYTLVAHSVIKAVFPPAKIQATRIETQVGDKIFVTTGNVILEKNWLEVKTGIKKDDELPVMSVGDKVDSNFNVKEKTTKPPVRYTDSTLLSAMLKAGKTIDDKDLRSFLSVNGDGGIGTEATRAGIIESVISRKYAKREGKYIVPEERGIELIKILPIKDLKSAELTARWEERLTDIQNKKDTLDNFIKDLQEQVKIWMKEVLITEMETKTKFENKGIGVQCPHCGGDIIENDYGFFCSKNERDNPSSCQFRIFKASSKFHYSPNLSKTDIQKLAREGKTGVKNAVSAKGNNYEFYFELSEDKQSCERKFPERKSTGTKVEQSEFTCPVCGEQLVHIKNLEKGWDFYSCQGHVTLSNNFFGTAISNQQLKTMLNGEDAGPFTFTDKSGNEYEGYLYLDMDEGKIKKRSK